MRNINTVADLKDAISELEFNKAVHRRMLKDSFNDTIESLKPRNIFKNISEALVDPDLLSNIIPAVVGMGTGFISNKISSTLFKRNRLTKFLTSIALYGVTKAFVRNPEISKVFGQRIVNSVIGK